MFDATTEEAYRKLLEFLRPFCGDSNGFMAFTKATRHSDPDKNKKWASYTNWFSEVGSGGINLPIEFIAEDPDHEYYFTPAIMAEEYRQQTKFKYSNAIWLDFDEFVDWQEFDPYPSIVVQTSEKKFHCYWLLHEPIEDMDEMRYWCSRFLEYFGDGKGDPAAKDASRLMKLPYGRNLKISSQLMDGTPFPPKVVSFNPELKYTEIDLHSIPEPESPIPEVVEIQELPSIPQTSKKWNEYLSQFRTALPSHLLEKILVPQEGGPEKRSGVLYSLTLELNKVLGDRENVFRILYGSPNDKFSIDHGKRKGAELLWKDINRTIEKNKVETTKRPEDLVSIEEILLNKHLGVHEKGVQIEEIVIKAVREQGKLVQTTVGDYFFVDTTGGKSKMYALSTKTESPFSGWVCRRFSINAGVDRTVLLGILHRAIHECQDEEPIEFYQFAHYDIMANICYVDRYDGSMYVLDGETISLHPYGYHEVYFYPKPQSNKYPISFEYTEDYEKGGLNSLILDGPNYTTEGSDISRRELRHMLKTWLTCFFFPELMDSKPIVLIHGGPESGKTTLFQALSVMLTGNSTYSVTGMPDHKSEFNNQVTQSSYLFYDNVQINKSEIQEKLCQLATGYTVKMRKYYTTNDMLTIEAKCFVGITSITIEKIQTDLVDRYMVFPVHPFSANLNHMRKPLNFLMKEVMENRNKLWGELLDFINKVVHIIGRDGLTQDSHSRMGDYEAILNITCSIDSVSPTRINNFITVMKDEITIENDALYGALIMLMKKYGSPTPWLMSRDMAKELSDLNRTMRVNYGTSHKMTRALKERMSKGIYLRQGLKIEHDDARGRNKFRIEDVSGGELLDD